MRTCFKLSPIKTALRRTTFTTILRRATVPCGPSCVSVGRERTRLVAYSTKASDPLYAFRKEPRLESREFSARPEALGCPSQISSTRFGLTTKVLHNHKSKQHRAGSTV